MDGFLLVALVVTLSGVFAMEYKSGDPSDGFSRILRTTARGRGHPFGGKLLVTVTVTAGLCVLYGAMDIATVAARYTLPAADAPLSSMPVFGAYDRDMSIGGCLPLCLFRRLLFGFLPGLFTAALSALLRRRLPVLLAVSSCLVVPAVLENVGFSFSGYMNYLSFSVPPC